MTLAITLIVFLLMVAAAGCIIYGIIKILTKAMLHAARVETEKHKKEQS